MRIVWIGGLGGIAALMALMACSASAGTRSGSSAGGNGSGSGGAPTSGVAINSSVLVSGPIVTGQVTTGVGGGADLGSCDGGCADFSNAPGPVITDKNSPPVATDIGLFTGTGSAPAPCLIEPVTVTDPVSNTQVGTLVPNNWLPPYVRWSWPTGATTMEVTFSAANQANVLTVYTSNQHGWTLDGGIWNAVRSHTYGLGAASAINVSIRAIVNGTLTAAATGSLNIATVNASGNIVYWATTGSVDTWQTATDSSYLAGFAVSTPGYTSVLTPSQVTQPIWGQNGAATTNWGTVKVPVMCVGCHVSTPDGQNAAFIAQFADPIVVASISADGGTPVGAAPSWLSSEAMNVLMGWPDPPTSQPNPWGQPLPGKDGDETISTYGMGTPSFSKAFWSDTSRLMVTSHGNDLAKWASELTNTPAQLYWIDLMATTNVSGMIPRTGDPRSAAVPSWSHDGTTILYTSTNVKNSERLGFNGNTGQESNQVHPPVALAPIADLYTVPFNNRAGGTATPVPGASSNTESEYYGSFSADDKLIAYNAVPTNVPAPAGAAGQIAGQLYNQPAAEVFVIPAGGGTGERLAANTPAMCTGLSSPGVNNSWPKWSPEVAEDPKTPGLYYYWIAFSSQRDPATGNAQLYLAPVTINNGTMVTYPAVYFWNQNAGTSNRTPAWDVFDIPATYTPSIH